MEKKLFSIAMMVLLFFLLIMPVQSIQIHYHFFKDPAEIIPGDMKSDMLPSRLFLPALQPQILKSSHAQRDPLIVDLISQLNDELYLEFLEELVDIGPRVTSTPECQEASNYIYDQFSSMGLSTRVQYWQEGSLNGTNVEATIPGVDEQSDDIYVICAHYDTVPYSPGADDDGSGTVAVLSAASLMKNYDFNHTIKFVTFSGEEQGLHGSYHYVMECLENEWDIAGVLNLDMIGYAPSENAAQTIRVFEGDFSQSLLDLTIEMTDLYDDVIDLEVIPSGFSWGSDHYYFWQAGYQAIFYIETDFNDFYHSSEDKIEHMNIPYAVEVSQLSIATLAELAEITLVEPPKKPSSPEGVSRGKMNIEYNYTAVTTDPQNDQVYYLFDWGDGEQSAWIGPFESGQPCEVTHSFNSQGSYSIKVKAKDSKEYESEWSAPLSITIAKNKSIQSILFQIRDHFINYHINLTQILQHISKI